MVVMHQKYLCSCHLRLIQAERRECNLYSIWVPNLYREGRVRNLYDQLCLKQGKVTQINWTLSINLHASLKLISFIFLLSLFVATYLFISCSSWRVLLKIIWSFSSAWVFLFSLLGFKEFQWKMSLTSLSFLLNFSSFWLFNFPLTF